jgi:hypothetical protein
LAVYSACQSEDFLVRFCIVKIGILANPHKQGSIPTLHALRSSLASRGCEVVLDEQTAALAGETGGIPAWEFLQNVDVAAVLGGDGTMPSLGSGDSKSPWQGSTSERSDF